MNVTRVRFWVLAFLLLLYLAGVLLLSAVTLHEPRNSGSNSKVTDHTREVAKLKNLEYGLPGFRPPLRRSRIQWCTDLKYLHPPRETIALASFPGSGNTWLRYLLQQATGIYTGSVYKDYGLLKNGFPAESVVNGSVLVVKIHEWGANARKHFSKAILLIRAPGPAIQAEFNRQSGGHIGFASPDRYKRTKGRHWQQFVNDNIQGWQKMNMDWLFNFTGPTHVIFYEQLVDNLEYTLKSVIKFIDTPFNPELFNCALERREGIYKRKKRILNFDPYTTKMKSLLQNVQEKVYQSVYNFASPAASKKR